MSLALYMDVHVPAAITHGLRLRGIDVLRAQEDGATRLPDEALLTRATQHGRLLFSQDEDLLAEAAERQARSVPFAGLAFARQMDVSIGACVRDLELICQVLNPDEVANRVIYLPL